MKVLYDITTLGNIHCAPGVQGAGIYRATLHLGQALAATPGIDLSLSAAPGQWHKVLRYLQETNDFDPERFIVPSHGSSPTRELSGLWTTNRGPLASHLVDYYSNTYHPRQVYNAGRFDLYHLNWRAATTIPANTFPTVVTSVFDVIALKRPDWFVEPGAANPIGDYLTELILSAGRRDHITVNAEAVKADILQLFPKISRNQVHVVPLGVSDRFTPCSEPALIAEVRSRYGIPAHKKYVLCVNTLEPRKNMKAAIEGFAEMMASQSDQDVCLVLAGSKGWLYDDIISHTEHFGLSEESIVFTGFVADDDIPVLYSGASAFCYPSLDEGFGLPVLEAMRCGVPVLTSDRAPLREVAGDAALFVDPTDPSQIAAGLSSILKEPGLARRLAESGAQRAAKFSWQNSAERMADVYNEVAPRRGALSRQSKVLSAKELTQELLAAPSVMEKQDAFRAQPAFIVGDGFSLEHASTYLIGEAFTIATNGAPGRLLGMRKPDCYVMADSTITPAAADRVNAMTGSLFVFSPDVAELRSGRDVRPSDFVDETSVLTGLPAPTAIGPGRSVQVAIHLAHWLGCNPIVLVGPEGDPVWAATLLASQRDRGNVKRAVDPAELAWHRACRRAFESQGRRIVATTPKELAGIYEVETLSQATATSEPREYSRGEQASLDETQAVALLFERQAPNHRVMLDVGAHRGTSAVHFVRGDWQIYCFEPDPENRSHLARKFGDAPNLSIDVRAVGEAPATQIPFFTSDVSSGISGLSSFHPSHNETGLVDVTTVAEIVESNGILKVDFLKIDVEGFDFGVLKGVPWATIRPSVIECEFEDAKTIPLGHTTSDIADYLLDLGYAVYLSEWHPIVEYGVPHDWRRVVPYPGRPIASDAWGNILAFDTDPGLDEVQDLLSAVTRRRRAVPKAAPTARPNPGRTDAAPTGVEATRAKVNSQVVEPKWRRRARRLVRALRARKKYLALVVGVAALLFALAAILPSRLAPYSASLAVLWAAAIGLFLLARENRETMRRVAASNERLERHEKRITREAARIARHVRTLQSEVQSERRLNLSLTSSNADARAQLSTLAASIRSTNGRLTATAAEQSAFSRQIKTQSDAALAASGERTALATNAEALAKDMAALEASLDRLSLEAESVGTRVDAMLSEQAGADLHDDLRRLQNQSAELMQHVQTSIESIGDSADKMLEFSNYANAGGLRMHTRRLSNEDVARVTDHWLRHLGLELTGREIRYLAHTICLEEERCDGRLATTVQSAVLRALVLLAVDSPRVEILEIGTLFGIAAGSLYQTAVRRGVDAFITLIDPLEGYYSSSPVDRQTGVAVTCTTLKRNLERLEVPADRYRLIQHKSTLPEAQALASDRTYDYVLIDGDHSLAGVANDFERFGSLVKPGGFLIFDDYDTEDWPAIKPYVDDHVRVLDEWMWIGAEWRTGILRKRAG